MQTRSKTVFNQHIVHPFLLLAHFEPKNFKQALSDKNWKVAMHREYDAVINQKA